MLSLTYLQVMVACAAVCFPTILAHVPMLTQDPSGDIPGREGGEKRPGLLVQD